MSEVEIVRLVVSGIQGLISLASALGFRDAAIAAADAALAAARAQTDRDLAEKHRQPTLPGVPASPRRKPSDDHPGSTGGE